MANMGHCRFQNTAGDLEDCVEHLNDTLSKEEHKARSRITELAQEIVDADNADTIPTAWD